ncbi:MAG: hypothetical protein LBN26_04280 [Christensenellaceae bacterium]|jgi:hypothetical protein|nr:hypothetical protein [Christensenellaceae bacterium]
MDELDVRLQAYMRQLPAAPPPAVCERGLAKAAQARRQTRHLRLQLALCSMAALASALLGGLIGLRIMARLLPAGLVPIVLLCALLLLPGAVCVGGALLQKALRSQGRSLRDVFIEGIT